jgi:hypothetical protein
MQRSRLMLIVFWGPCIMWMCGVLDSKSCIDYNPQNVRYRVFSFVHL